MFDRPVYLVPNSMEQRFSFQGLVALDYETARLIDFNTLRRACIINLRENLRWKGQTHFCNGAKLKAYVNSARKENKKEDISGV